MNSAIQQSEPPKQTRQPIWKILAAVVIGVALLYFAFAKCDLEKLLEYVKQVNLSFVALVFISGLMSHFIRAVRWVILLNPVADRKVSLWNSFYAVMIGYAVNVVIPRGGEVARLVAMSRMEKLPWAGVLPTMFIDRLIDIVLLGFLVGLTLTVLPKSVMDQLPALTIGGTTIPWMVIGGTGMLTVSVIVLLLLPKMSAIIRFFTSRQLVRKALPERVLNVLEEKIAEFDRGAKCLSNPINYPIIAGLSVLMWFFYWVNFYLMLYAFDMQTQVSALDCLIAFTIGSVGVLVPTPGSAGSFHLLVQQGLMLTAGVNQEQALAYATVLHVMAFIVVTCVPAAFCMLIEGVRNKGEK